MVGSTGRFLQRVGPLDADDAPTAFAPVPSPTRTQPWARTSDAGDGGRRPPTPRPDGRSRSREGVFLRKNMKNRYGTHILIEARPRAAPGSIDQARRPLSSWQRPKDAID